MRAGPTRPGRSRSRSTWSSPTEGGEGATPYEVLLHAALVGNSTRFTRQDCVEEPWRVMQPLLDAPPPVHPYAPGVVGPGGRRQAASPASAAGTGRGWCMSADAYDVIIVGTGAGGGTLARQLAPSGKRILLLERGDWLPREPQNWLAQDVFVDNRYVSPGHVVRRATGKPFQPQVHYFVGGATKLYGAALYRLRAEDFGELRHHDGLSPAWPIAYDELEPYYTWPSRSTRCTAPAARIRPSRRRARRIRSRPCRTSRGSSSSPTTWPRPATTRSMRRAASG